MKYTAHELAGLGSLHTPFYHCRYHPHYLVRAVMMGMGTKLVLDYPSAFYEYEHFDVIPLDEDPYVFELSKAAGMDQAMYNFLIRYYDGSGGIKNKVVMRLDDVMDFALYEKYDIRDLLYKAIGLEI